MTINTEQTSQEIISKSLDSIAAIFITDLKGNLTYVNDNFCQVTEYKRDELVGNSVRMFKSGYHTEDFYRHFWMTIKAGQTWSGTFCNKTKSGKLVWLETVIEPSFDEHKNIFSYVGLRLNVTKKMETIVNIEEREKGLDDISRLAALGEISAYIAHEINNPLTIMKLAVDSMNATVNAPSIDVEKIKKLNSKIHNVADKIARIVVTITNLSRHNPIVSMQHNKLKDILEDALLISSDIIKTIGANLVLENNTNSELNIICHKHQITQVLISVIKNACEVVPPSDHRKIKININLQDNNLEIKISDSGPKISNETAENIFKPYFTIKHTEKSQSIGLTNSVKIISSHGGKLFIDQESSETCFKIILPLKP